MVGILVHGDNHFIVRGHYTRFGVTSGWAVTRPGRIAARRSYPQFIVAATSWLSAKPENSSELNA